MNNREDREMLTAGQPMNVQWFPGHMAKTRRLISQSLKLVDLVIEILDARIPLSSKNPEIDRLTAGKPRLVLLNKSDLADAAVNRLWVDYYRRQGILCLLIDSKSGKGVPGISDAVKRVLKEKLERYKAKGMEGKRLRIMIVGVPNVGKSSLINRMSGKVSAKAEDRPGVTRGKQWVSLDKGLELLDTPGVLWPKFEDPATGELLAMTGAVKDEILDIELLAVRLLERICLNYSNLLIQRYKLQDTREMTGYDLLVTICKKRGMLISGGEVDTLRAASMVLDEFRGAKIGHISLEKPSAEESSL